MNKKIEKFILIMYIISLMFLLTGATYAYFTVLRVSNVSSVIEVDTARLDSILFETGLPISIYADERNFNQGMGNISSETTARAYLKTTKEDATYKYNVYLELTENNFVYSTENKKAEVILKVINPSGEEVKSLDGLNYVTGNGYSGFDITDAQGKYDIAKNYVISTNNEIVHEWKLSVTLVNLDTDQEVNAGKNLNGYIKIEKGS